MQRESRMMVIEDDSVTDMMGEFENSKRTLTFIFFRRRRSQVRPCFLRERGGESSGAGKDFSRISILFLRAKSELGTAKWKGKSKGKTHSSRKPLKSSLTVFQSKHAHTTAPALVRKTLSISKLICVFPPSKKVSQLEMRQTTLQIPRKRDVSQI